MRIRCNIITYGKYTAGLTWFPRMITHIMSLVMIYRQLDKRGHIDIATCWHLTAYVANMVAPSYIANCWRYIAMFGVG